MSGAASLSLRKSVSLITADKIIALTILVSALGYFVDVFDLLLFSIVRVQSLKDLGVGQADMLSVGIRLLNIQMAGLLLGGFIWGVLGDKFGRVSVLFGSILLYSIGNIGCGFVNSVDGYAALRFITGLGLAGEMGVGVTLASELMPKETRGLGVTFISFIGILGATAAYYISVTMGWRDAYILGGVLGLGLLVLRSRIRESGMYHKMEKNKKKSARGNILLFFKKPELLKKYLMVVLVGAPIWATVGVFITFSPEFARAFGMTVLPDPGKAVLFGYGAAAFAGIFIGVISQKLRSRKKAILISLLSLIGATFLYVTVRTGSLTVFYILCGALGLGCSYSPMFVQVGAEQFGTNIRATAATSIPNVVRGLTIPMTSGFHALIPMIGVAYSGVAVMTVTVMLALVSLWKLRETFHVDLDYIEGQI
jgi:putative MFS transporter